MSTKTGTNAIKVEEVYDQLSGLLENPQVRLAHNILSRNPLVEVVRDQAKAASYTYKYSDTLSTKGKITSQHSSGRCWIFACMNVIRLKMMEKFNLPESFELSQSYLFFFDKLERCQFFIENILDTADEDVSGRMISFLLQSPVMDGGQWDMLVNLVCKYGLVPKSVFPDPQCAKASRPMNRFLTNRLRTFAKDLRTILAQVGGNKEAPEIITAKAKMLEEVRRELVTFFGAPPKTFTWSYDDKDKKHHVIRDISPQQFYLDAGFDMSTKFSLVNDPRNDYYTLITVEKLGNMVGGRNTLYINVPIEVLKQYARKVLDSKQPVWFGCDMGKHIDRGLCVLDNTLQDYQLVFGADPDGLSKRERLEYGESLMTHAMVFTGYDRGADDSTVAWLVENSWGEKGPDKGMWYMSDSWFSEYVFQIVVDVGMLEEKVRAVLDQKPKVLPPWDPMGALASSL
jgi:bleomycin hydrolase